MRKARLIPPQCTKPRLKHGNKESSLRRLHLDHRKGGGTRPDQLVTLGARKLNLSERGPLLEEAVEDFAVALKLRFQDCMAWALGEIEKRRKENAC